MVQKPSCLLACLLAWPAAATRAVLVSTIYSRGPTRACGREPRPRADLLDLPCSFLQLYGRGSFVWLVPMAGRGSFLWLVAVAGARSYGSFLWLAGARSYGSLLWQGLVPMGRSYCSLLGIPNPGSQTTLTNSHQHRSRLVKKEYVLFWVYPIRVLKRHCGHAYKVDGSLGANHAAKHVHIHFAIVLRNH
eukprot:COSAG06_NODE_5277_length_3590_cov_19.689487_1_plen_190_part_00